MSTTEEDIQLAIETGELLRILYHGGSQPGTLREISPKSLKNGKTRAYCYSSGAVKTFMLNKIEIVSNEYAPKEPEWSPVSAQSPSYESIAAFAEKERSYLESLGWYVDVKDDYFALHRPAKAGNPRPINSPTVWLEYEEYTYDMIFREDGEFHKENIRKRKLPWVIRSDYKNTKTLGSLDKTVSVILKWAKELSPKA